MTLTNTTVAQNTAANLGGGGIRNFNGILFLQSTTIAENHAGFLGAGGGIENSGTAPVQNTIIARNDRLGQPSPRF
jgi:predicted outer membrane repeat protein